MKLLPTLQPKGKTVLVRLDLDLTDNEIDSLDHPRVTRTLPTLKYLLEKGAKVVVIGHRGRPEKEDKELSLQKFAWVYKNLLGINVGFGETLDKSYVAELLSKFDLVVLENLRFYKEEEDNDLGFAKQLAELAQVYVFESFGMAHREHASVVSLPRLLPTYVGFDFAQEIETLTQVKNHPKRPFVVVIGGAKLETKLPLLKQFLKTADYILVGGKLLEEELPADKKIIPPLDVVEALNKQGHLVNQQVKKYDLETKTPETRIVDIGPKTIDKFEDYIHSAGTVLWNGAMGIFEEPKFAKGTSEVARAIADSNAFSVIGGGETVLFAKVGGLLEKYDHVSLGGGAMMEFFVMDQLPVMEVLE